MAQDPAFDLPTYTPTARRFHWLIFFLLLLQFPMGLYMTYRGYEMEGVNDKGEVVKGVWDAVTNTLYSSHKLLGVTILLLVLLRLVYRLRNGAPQPDPSVPKVLVGVGHVVHWLIYLLLIVVPIIGYIGISYGAYLDVFGLPFPALTEKDEKFAEEVFEVHEGAAFTLLVLIILHFGGALYHKMIRKDRVVERMLPKRIT